MNTLNETKKSLANIYNDLRYDKISLDTFTKNHRLFYLGISIITVLVIALLLLLLQRSFNNKIIIEHIHKHINEFEKN